MNTKLVLEFLRDLSSNNSKQWMEQNRNRYTEVRNMWMTEVEMFLRSLAIFDERLEMVQAKDTVHRINNNRRFQPDKPLYKDNFTFTPFMKIAPASFHLSISPGNSFVGGGLYRPPSDILAKVRGRIDRDGELLEEILNESEFSSFYGGLGLQEEALKSAPLGYAKAHPHIDKLRMKSFVVMKRLSDRVVIETDLLELVENSFLISKPLIDYLNLAID
ncbi:MAG: DUF2461 domain-containing protein [Ignavibacteriales bacterium]|nr:DUF2461 domain-containing protein [Ignavibacteriales bacterium]